MRTGVFPGCVGLVWRAGSTLYEEAHGSLATHTATCALLGGPLAANSGGPAKASQSGERRANEASLATVYDLASLTKVLATTTLVAQTLEAGLLSLDAPVPSPWGAACPGATLRDLLEHCSGLAAHREYFTHIDPLRDHGDFAEGAAAVLNAVCHTPPAYPLRERAVYSDLGFMIIGAWLERVLDTELDVAFAERIARPLGFDEAELGFRRLRGRDDIDPGRAPATIAPTEVYTDDVHPEPASHVLVRREVAVARGVVHDDNAYVMGGVAGHAGLFGTARAVLRIARAWLEPSTLGVSERVRDLFWQPSAVPGSTRRLGFDGPDAGGTGSSGRALSPRAVGHTGYTGTSLWIDPAPASRGPFIGILLSNRVHPTRFNDQIRGFRPRFYELAAVL